MTRRANRGLLAITVVVVGFAGCGRSGTELPEGFDIPGPRFPTTETATPGPTPTPTSTGLPTDVGDGHDGALEISVDTVVNACMPVLNSSGTEVSLGTMAAQPFEIGRRVILHQVQDNLATSNDPLPVTVGDGGKWELARIAVVDATSVTLEAPLSRAYQSVSGKTAQMCSVPEYSIVTLTGAGTDLQAPPWDGQSGGILALFVSESLTVGGGQVSARNGFRGGVVAGDSGSMDVDDDDTAVSGEGGGKGEGLDGRSYDLDGRGNYWNAGGGGNGRCGGGGGGGGAGAGGRGGTQKESDGANSDVNGRPGSAVVYTDVRLVFGGGGGAGQRESSSDDAGDGGIGGGAAVLFINSLLGSGTINVSGQVGENGTLASAGGGGGGGTVVLMVSGTLSAGVTIDASGAQGGNHVSNDNRRGPGGGGGGGHAFVKLTGAMTIDTNGSLSGRNTNISADPYEAEPGLPGRLVVLP